MKSSYEDYLIKKMEVQVREQSYINSGGSKRDEFNRAASHIDGATSILTGIAGNISLKTGQAVKVDGLVKF